MPITPYLQQALLHATFAAASRAARRYNADPADAVAPVYLCLISRLTRAPVIVNLPAYIGKTARLEANKYFVNERRNRIHQPAETQS